jgi:hypothetical protein
MLYLLYVLHAQNTETVLLIFFIITVLGGDIR